MLDGVLWELHLNLETLCKITRRTFLSFNYFFLTLSQSVLGEVLGHIRFQLQETEEMHDVINCVPSHALEMPSDLLNIQSIFSVSTDCVG